MATPVKKILIVRGDESRMIRPAYLRTWQRQGWDLAPEGWEPPADPDAEEVQVIPSQEEINGQLALSEESEKKSTEDDETEPSDLSEDEGEASPDDSADDAKEN